MDDFDRRALTLGAVLRTQAARHGERIFLDALEDDRRYSYSEVATLVARWAGGLARLGIVAGEHVAVMMENRPAALWTYFALGWRGAVSVPLNTAAKGALLKYYLDHSDAVAVVADPEMLERLAPLLPELPRLRLLVVAGPRAVAAGLAARLTVAELAELDAGDPAAATDPGAAPRYDTLACLSYTSGTTGPSKGVMFTHASTLSWAIANARSYEYGPDDVNYVCLPLFHSNAWHATLAMLVVGGRVVLARRFSASRFWDDIRSRGVTIFNALGSMQNILWSLPAGSGDRAHRVRLCLLAPVPPFATAWEARYGVTIVSSYGLTDFGTPTAFTARDPRGRLGSAGRARPGMSIRIVDADDFEVAPGEKGEILLRGELPWTTAPGYYKMPEETLRSRRNFWFHTGDRGYLDADGYLYFADRIKDAIRRRGENISAYEVEQVLLAHPAVAEAAVYAVSSEMSEDEVAATIVPRAGAQPDPVELLQWCATNMAVYMVPRYLQFSSDPPRTETQKIEKYKLRQAAEADRSLLWDRETAGVSLPRR